jgi:aminomuconate-semialdehyde/2-hydroxymuconate-6-semialdehyde dehydrogenase
MKRLHHFIAGEFVPPSTGRWFEDVNPATGEVIALVAEGDTGDIDRAVAAAQQAFEGPWGKMPLAQRLDLLDAVAARIMERFEEFLEAEIGDTGKPRRFAGEVDIPRGAANFRFFAHAARSLGTTSFFTDTPDGKGAVNYVHRSPVGVIGVISPWNLPLLLLT